ASGRAGWPNRGRSPPAPPLPALGVDDLLEVFPRLLGSLPLLPRLRIDVANGHDRAQEPVRWHVEDALGLLGGLAAEPANRGTEAVRCCRQHDALREPAFVVGIEVWVLGVAGHDQ